jgi:hypothetical protein
MKGTVSVSAINLGHVPVALEKFSAEFVEKFVEKSGSLANRPYVSARSSDLHHVGASATRTTFSLYPC